MRTSCSEVVAPLIAALVLSGCAPLTVPQEQQLGEDFVRNLSAEVRFLGDDVVSDYVDDIGERIIRAAGPQPFTYNFYVVEDDHINASAGPGGHIFIHTETILQAANVSELAGVLAHEIGHVALRHVAENMNRRRNAGLLTQLGAFGASAFGYGGLASLGGQMAAMAVLNTFSREAEEEADAFAVEVMPKADYSPDGLVTFFYKLLQEGGSSPAAFLSSHPTTQDRISETSALIQMLPPTPGLEVTDRGKLEIIKRRIRLLTGQQDRRNWNEPRRAPPRPEEPEPTFEPL